MVVVDRRKDDSVGRSGGSGLCDAVRAQDHEMKFCRVVGHGRFHGDPRENPETPVQLWANYEGVRGYHAREWRMADASRVNALAHQGASDDHRSASKSSNNRASN